MTKKRTRRTKSAEEVRTRNQKPMKKSAREKNANRDAPNTFDEEKKKKNEGRSNNRKDNGKQGADTTTKQTRS